MIEAAERLLNLALCLADARGTITADAIRERVTGYPEGQDEAAFKRMLERDKEALRAAGFVFDADDEGNYRFNRTETYLTPVNLSDEESAAVRAAAGALLGDPSFPFADELRLALAKLDSHAASAEPLAESLLADEDPERQSGIVAVLAAASAARKRVTFGYTNSQGAARPHTIEPYGLFAQAGRWYVVGRDTDIDEVRTYAAPRMEAPEANAASPKSPDFELPEGFDVHSFVALPFQYGPAEAEFEARVRFVPEQAWRAGAITGGRGRLSADSEGSVVWSVPARSTRELLRFVVENGPGLSVEGPSELVDEYRGSLARAEAAHG